MQRLGLRLLATAGALALVAVSHLELADRTGQAYTEAGLKRALIAFGVARALNGVISVAQGTEIAVEPAGVGVTFKPGEILDPLNDLIERFSWVMLVSGTSLGIQRVLLSIAAARWFGVAMSACVLASALLAWRPLVLPARVRRVVRSVAAVLVIARFAIPVIAIANELLYDAFLEPQYTRSTQKLEETAAAIQRAGDEPDQPVAGENESVLDGARRAYRSARDAMAVDARIAMLKQAAADVGEYTIDLIVVFVLQTILFPLLFLWLTVQLLRRCVADLR